MTRDELKIKLNEMNIPEDYYSLYDDLGSDRIIIFHNYSKWEVFFYERGSRRCERIFLSENDACEYVLKYFINLKQWSEKYDRPL
jgi:hypothetical protein